MQEKVSLELLKPQEHPAEINKYHTVTQKDRLHFSFSSQHRKNYFSSLWLRNPSCSSKWTKLVFNQVLFGPNCSKVTLGKFSIEQKTEVTWSKDILTEPFPLLSTTLNRWHL